MINAPRSEDYLVLWNLIPDGEPVATHSSGLLPVLHGNIHHRNILDFGARGWLAIDPPGRFEGRLRSWPRPVTWIGSG